MKLATGHLADVPLEALRHKDGLREEQIKEDEDTLVFEDANNKRMGWLTKPEVASKDYRRRAISSLPHHGLPCPGQGKGRST